MLSSPFAVLIDLNIFFKPYLQPLKNGPHRPRPRQHPYPR